MLAGLHDCQEKPGFGRAPTGQWCLWLHLHSALPTPALAEGPLRV